MSDPVTKAEVADVLSSIRRLVGDTKEPSTIETQSAKKELLVLTPQLRVTAPEILRLMPEDVVSPAPDEWQEFEEPPLPASNLPSAVPETVMEAAPLIDSAEVTRSVITPKKAHLALSEKIAALETAIARTEDQWEPDGTGRDAYSGTRPPAMTWQDGVDLDGTGRPVHAVNFPVVQRETERKQEKSAEEDPQEDVIDEATLRAMVAQIVRSELQGELGERITRNVRKLVRREIQRALTARALD